MTVRKSGELAWRWHERSAAERRETGWFGAGLDASAQWKREHDGKRKTPFIRLFPAGTKFQFSPVILPRFVSFSHHVKHEDAGSSLHRLLRVVASSLEERIGLSVVLLLFHWRRHEVESPRPPGGGGGGGGDGDGG